jgi:hypothetical protein
VVCIPEFLVALRPEDAGEVADAAGVGGLGDADALHGHAGDLRDVALERPPAGDVPLLGLEREREDLRHGPAEERAPELRAERVVRDDDDGAAVRHHGRGHRGAGVLPPRPAGLHPAEVDLGEPHGLLLRGFAQSALPSSTKVSV